MATQAKTIQLGNKADGSPRVLLIQYSSNALRRLEQTTGKSTAHVGLLLQSGRGGFGLLQEVLWAGLEGARMKHMTSPQPYTVEEVGDWIDDFPGGAPACWDEKSPVANAVLEAWQDAFPTTKREDLPKAKEGANPTDGAQE